MTIGRLNVRVILKVRRVHVGKKQKPTSIHPCSAVVDSRTSGNKGIKNQSEWKHIWSPGGKKNGNLGVK